jgi:uncharacterized protein (DUF433 family)
MKLPPFLTEVEPNEIRLTGHRIGLYHIIDAHVNEGLREEALSEEFPTLTREQIRGVLEFYAVNRAEVDAYVAWYKTELDRQYREDGGRSLEELRRRVLARGGDVSGIDRLIELRRRNGDR